MARLPRMLPALILFFAAPAFPASPQAHRAPRHSPASDAITPAEIARQKALGSPGAPIRMDEFTDFECPGCRMLYLETLRPLIQNYVATGKVYLVHHDFPLPIHPYSRQAASLATAAAAIGRFAPVERALFEHQAEWASRGDFTPVLARVLSPAELKRVEELARTAAVHDSVASDVQMGRAFAVHLTPTMFVLHDSHRLPLPGVISYPALRRFLDALLKR